MTDVPQLRRGRSATKQEVKQEIKQENGVASASQNNGMDDRTNDVAPKPLKKQTSTSKAAATTTRKKKADEEPPLEVKKHKSVPAAQEAKAAAAKSMKTIVVRGVAPVDSECPSGSKMHVYHEGKDIYDVMLNQTDVRDNHNKYYIIQLLENNDAKTYSVWQRWGRVGYKGQNNLVNCGTNLDKAKDTFCKKFSDKTKNEWADRKRFRKVAGKYDLVEVDYSAKKEEDTKEEPASTSVAKKTPLESKLEKQIQDLLTLICDIHVMEDSVREMSFDAEKCPLGRLTEAQIKAGYIALKKVEACLANNDRGLVEACNEFYTRIPHCFGMKRPPVIHGKAELKEKLLLLEALGDIEIAIRTLKSEGNEQLHPLDRHYLAMDCNLHYVTPGSDEFKMIDKYLQNTHGSTHQQYTMTLDTVFECQKGKDEDFMADVGNRMLLWHGSRLGNWYGILSQNLRIAPPEAPVTGYMFGKGIYFADMSSKSANYCFATSNKPTGLLLLCDVALGKPRDLLAADYKADKLPSGFHSTRGLGQLVPDPAQNFVMDDGLVVPLGKESASGVKNPGGYTLQYNEYVVYNPRQVRPKYLVKIKFNFKH